MVASAALVLSLAAASGLATPESVSAVLDRLGDADVVVVNDPQGTRPVRVLAATRVSVPAEKVRRLLAEPASYASAMPSFRRVEVVSRHEHGRGVVDLEIAWELEVPLWNLEGKLWLRPRPDGVDLELEQGDFAPGLFHITARDEKPGRTVLAIEGFANVRDANWATRRLARRSALAEPAISVAAAYVLLKALALQAERGMYARPSAALTAPDPSAFDGVPVGLAADIFADPGKVLAAVRSRNDGRLLRVEVAVHTAASAATASDRSNRPEVFRALPGWRKVTPVGGKAGESRVDECKDGRAQCWEVDTNLPFFSLDGIWKIWPRPWRARAVDGDGRGAVMAIDILPGKIPDRAVVVLSQHPRIDKAGYVARKLIAAEPLLEHGLTLALTLVDAVALGSALQRD
jgi:hypothetical protein